MKLWSRVIQIDFTVLLAQQIENMQDYLIIQQYLMAMIEKDSSS